MTTQIEPSQQKRSPMMEQWHACKEKAGSALLLFRLGDFYEAFYDDAVVIARELELTLTKRQEVPMAGVPCHAYEGYLDKLLAKGFRVAIAEQTEDPKETKGLVKREVVKVVTPGAVVDSNILSDNSNNYFAAVAQVGSSYGLAFVDLTTGEFYITEFEETRSLANELFRLRPREFLLPHKLLQREGSLFKELEIAYPLLINSHEDWQFDHQITYSFLTNHFKTQSLDGFGLKGQVAGINAGGALLRYLQETLYNSLEQITEVRTYTTTQYMTLDATTQRNLELTEPMHDGNRAQTLLNIVDATKTPMGGRLMRHWVKQPLLDVNAIEERQQAVSTLVDHNRALAPLHRLLDSVRDLERLMVKISAGNASPRDLLSLRFSIEPIPQIKELLVQLPALAPLLQQISDNLTPLPQVTQLIARALNDEAPARINDGNTFRTGFHAELDELRSINHDSKSWLASYQASLRDSLDIKSLKIGYNRMFGYYIEVSKGQIAKVPAHFQRRQTLVNGERYINDELKDHEAKVLSAEERILAIETELFAQLRSEIAKSSRAVTTLAATIALLDTLQSLAQVAFQRGYCCPKVDSSSQLMISEGRHPVIEASGNAFVANDTAIDGINQRLLLITGPNMSGKSTYIRQVALIAIMAQMGSFVPARSAYIGLIDKVFTRIGASDNLARGQSTFMVEMTETANILHNATDRSLVILDEIGRGTSTYDGISIAWSVAEHLLTVEGSQAKTLFATHYWELTKLEEKVSGAVNCNVAVHEQGDEVIFLHRIVPGSTDKSYGIHVARLAGLPSHVIARSQEILAHLEENANRQGVFEPTQPQKRPARRRTPKQSDGEIQLSLFEGK